MHADEDCTAQWKGPNGLNVCFALLNKKSKSIIIIGKCVQQLSAGSCHKHTTATCNGEKKRLGRAFLSAAAKRTVGSSFFSSPLKHASILLFHSPKVASSIVGYSCHDLQDLRTGSSSSRTKQQVNGSRSISTGNIRIACARSSLPWSVSQSALKWDNAPHWLVW